MYTYLLDIQGNVRTDMILRDSDGVYVPTDSPDNLDSAAYLDWASDKNNKPTTPAALSKVPPQVPMWAMQAALKQAGKYDAINSAIVGNASASPPVASMEASNPAVFFAWTMGNFASRQSTLIGALAKQFGISDADIDALFIAADKISSSAG